MKRIFFESEGQDQLWLDIDEVARVMNTSNQKIICVGTQLLLPIPLYEKDWIRYKSLDGADSYPINYQVKNIIDFPQVLHSDIKEGDSVYWWLEDKVEEGGGTWCYYHAKMYKGALCLLQDGFNYEKNEDKPNEVGAFADYKIVRYAGAEQ